MTYLYTITRFLYGNRCPSCGDRCTYDHCQACINTPVLRTVWPHTWERVA